MNKNIPAREDSLDWILWNSPCGTGGRSTPDADWLRCNALRSIDAELESAEACFCAYTSAGVFGGAEFFFGSKLCRLPVDDMAASTSDFDGETCFCSSSGLCTVGEGGVCCCCCWGDVGGRVLGLTPAAWGVGGTESSDACAARGGQRGIGLTAAMLIGVSVAIGSGAV